MTTNTHPLRAHTFSVGVAALALAMLTGAWLQGRGLRAELFPDVPANHPYAASIQFMRDRGIIQGYPDGTFRPDALVSRAEMIKIVIGPRADSAERDRCAAEPSFTPLFADVLDPQAVWYGPYLCVAFRDAIISGYPDNTFRPAKSISIEETAKIVSRAYAITPGVDAPTEPWYAGYMQALRSRNLIPDTVYLTGQLVTRGELAEMLARVIRLQGSATGTPAEGIRLSDPNDINPITIGDLHPSAGDDPFGGSPSITGNGPITIGQPNNPGSTAGQGDPGGVSIGNSNGITGNPGSITLTPIEGAPKPAIKKKVPAGYPSSYKELKFEEVYDRKQDFLRANGTNFFPYFDIYGFVTGITTNEGGFQPDITGNGVRFSEDVINTWDDFIRRNKDFFGVDNPEAFHLEEGQGTNRASFTFQGPALPGVVNSVNLNGFFVNGDERGAKASLSGHLWPGAKVPTEAIITEEDLRKKLIDKKVKVTHTFNYTSTELEGRQERIVAEQFPTWGLGWKPCQPPAECPLPDKQEFEYQIVEEDLSGFTVFPLAITREGQTKLEFRLVYRVNVLRREDDNVRFAFSLLYDALTGEDLKPRVICKPEKKEKPLMTGVDPAKTNSPEADPDQELPENYPPVFAKRFEQFEIEDFIAERNENLFVSGLFVDTIAGLLSFIGIPDDRLVGQPDPINSIYPLDAINWLSFNDGEVKQWKDFLQYHAEVFGIEGTVKLTRQKVCGAPDILVVEQEFPDRYNFFRTHQEAKKDREFWPTVGPLMTLSKNDLGGGQLQVVISGHHFPDAELPKAPVLTREDIESLFVDQFELNGEPLRRENLMILLGPAFLDKLRLVYWVGLYNPNADFNGQRYTDSRWIRAIDAMTGEEVQRRD